MRFASLAFVAVLFGNPAQAAIWNVDHAHSKLGFAVQWSGQPFIAMFQKWNAQIEFDPADLAHAKADVTIDMASAVSGEADLDLNLPGAQGFDVEHFPQARFVTRSFRSLGKDRYEAVADLTIRGVTKTVMLPFTLNIQGDRAHMKGQATVMRTDFSVGSGDMWEGETPVAHAVKVTVDLTAVKAR
jgi:polyisoprenoid-binding protein YceI